ncbi:hypothetical protein CROQUDRAFT_681165 [Cronartium quercuum f. sp. fusiforme G11]|uniref:Uncharacterized protein n=1 Tax=Cronartium quercuum f. sp. fusiforme G11 TaxID=708437 RepID=A0A9P6NBS8_9BASI|nr:hypothetical protein CROQUDRAFT_681165 [Cronartium quercuum f. sp. fusiforme G11]
MDVAATQNKIKEDAEKRRAKMKHTLLVHHGQPSPTTVPHIHPETDVSSTNNVHDNLDWGNILKSFVDIMKINSHPDDIRDPTKLQSHILNSNPFILSKLSHDQSGSFTYLAYVRYVMEKLGTYFFFKQGFTARNRVPSGSQSIIQHLEEFQVEHSRTFYGEAYDHYMSFVDMVEHCLTAGYQSRQAIANIAASPSEGKKFIINKHWLRGDSKMNGIQSMHKEIFETDPNTRKQTFSLSELIFVDPFMKIESGPKETIMEQRKKNFYLASQSSINFASQLQGFALGNLELNPIVTRSLDHLQGWKTFFQKWNAQDPHGRDLAPKIEKRYSVAYKQLDANKKLELALDEVLDSLFIHKESPRSKGVTIEKESALLSTSQEQGKVCGIFSKNERKKFPSKCKKQQHLGPVIAINPFQRQNSDANGLDRYFLHPATCSSSNTQENQQVCNPHRKCPVPNQYIQFSPGSTSKFNADSQSGNGSSPIEIVETDSPCQHKRKLISQHCEDLSSSTSQSDVNCEQFGIPNPTNTV